MCWKKLTKSFFLAPGHLHHLSYTWKYFFFRFMYLVPGTRYPVHGILFFLQIHVLSLSPLWCNFIKWDWFKCSIHFLRCPWQKRLQNGLNLRTLTLLYAGRPVLNLDFCELELWPDADQNQTSLHPFFYVALHWLTRYCSNRYICIIIYILHTYIWITICMYFSIYMW